MKYKTHQLTDKQYEWILEMIQDYSEWLVLSGVVYPININKLKDILRLGFYLETDRDWLNSLRKRRLKYLKENKENTE